ncbi:MAG: hypothetical protein ACRDNX_12470, partial [Gaiellaceae bacterium]
MGLAERRAFEMGRSEIRTAKVDSRQIERVAARLVVAIAPAEHGHGGLDIWARPHRRADVRVPARLRVVARGGRLIQAPAGLLADKSRQHLNDRAVILPRVPGDP